MVDRPRTGYIAGTGSFTPTRILTNADLERMVDTSDEWIVTRTGIKERHIAEPGLAGSDMAYEAARKALVAAGTEAGELDMIIVATVTPDHPFPSCACSLQARLGATKAAAFDVGAACSGFIYALNIGWSMIRSGSARTILVIGVEVLSRITDYTDRSTCVLFGDAAGAAILKESPDPERGILSVAIGSDGSFGDLLYLPGGGSRSPSSHETVERHQHFIHMSGSDVFKIAVRGMETISRQALGVAGVPLEQIDLLIPHQANLRIIDATAKRLQVPPAKVMVNIDRFGNTSSASIPLALDEAVTTGRVQSGHTIVMVAFGGGLTWGAAVVRWF